MLAIRFKAAHRHEMGVANRQPAKALLQNQALQLHEVHLQPADRYLDRHDPQRGLAHKHLGIRRPHALHRGIWPRIAPGAAMGQAIATSSPCSTTCSSCES